MRKVLVVNEERMELVAKKLVNKGYLAMDKVLVDGDVYILPPSMSKQRFLKLYPELNNKFIYDAKDYYLEDDIQMNAVYTAQGTLAVLLSLIKEELHHIQVDVIGYGRCGKAIYQLLNRLNIPVRVITRQKLSDVYYHDYQGYKPAKIIINTQDDICFSKEALRNCELILDIASQQTFADEIIQSSHYHQLKALPSKFVLKDAALLLEHAIGRCFDEK